MYVCVLTDFLQFDTPSLVVSCKSKQQSQVNSGLRLYACCAGYVSVKGKGCLLNAPSLGCRALFL